MPGESSAQDADAAHQALRKALLDLRAAQVSFVASYSDARARDEAARRADEARLRAHHWERLARDLHER